MGKLHNVTVQWEDGTTTNTNCNGELSEDEVRRYYVGNEFPMGERFPGDPARMVKAVAVTFNGFTITCPFCGMGQIPLRPDRKCDYCGKPLE